MLIVRVGKGLSWQAFVNMYQPRLQAHTPDLAIGGDKGFSVFPCSFARNC